MEAVGGGGGGAASSNSDVVELQAYVESLCAGIDDSEDLAWNVMRWLADVQVTNVETFCELFDCISEDTDLRNVPIDGANGAKRAFYREARKRNRQRRMRVADPEAGQYDIVLSTTEAPWATVSRIVQKRLVAAATSAMTWSFDPRNGYTFVDPETGTKTVVQDKKEFWKVVLPPNPHLKLAPSEQDGGVIDWTILHPPDPLKSHAVPYSCIAFTERGTIGLSPTLPAELLTKVLSHLTWDQLRLMQFVCKRWRTVIGDCLATATAAMHTGFVSNPDTVFRATPELLDQFVNHKLELLVATAQAHLQFLVLEINLSTQLKQRKTAYNATIGLHNEHATRDNRFLTAEEEAVEARHMHAARHASLALQNAREHSKPTRALENGGLLRGDTHRVAWERLHAALIKFKGANATGSRLPNSINDYYATAGTASESVVMDAIEVVFEIMSRFGWNPVVVGTSVRRFLQDRAAMLGLPDTNDVLFPSFRNDGNLEQLTQLLERENAQSGGKKNVWMHFNMLDILLFRASTDSMWRDLALRIAKQADKRLDSMFMNLRNVNTARNVMDPSLRTVSADELCRVAASEREGWTTPYALRVPNDGNTQAVKAALAPFIITPEGGGPSVDCAIPNFGPFELRVVDPKMNMYHLNVALRPELAYTLVIASSENEGHKAWPTAPIRFENVRVDTPDPSDLDRCVKELIHMYRWDKADETWDSSDPLAIGKVDRNDETRTITYHTRWDWEEAVPLLSHISFGPGDDLRLDIRGYDMRARGIDELDDMVVKVHGHPDKYPNALDEIDYVIECQPESYDTTAIDTTAIWLNQHSRYYLPDQLQSDALRNFIVLMKRVATVEFDMTEMYINGPSRIPADGIIFDQTTGATPTLIFINATADGRPDDDHRYLHERLRQDPGFVALIAQVHQVHIRKPTTPYMHDNITRAVEYVRKQQKQENIAVQTI